MGDISIKSRIARARKTMENIIQIDQSMNAMILSSATRDLPSLAESYIINVCNILADMDYLINYDTLQKSIIDNIDYSSLLAAFNHYESILENNEYCRRLYQKSTKALVESGRLGIISALRYKNAGYISQEAYDTVKRKVKREESFRNIPILLEKGILTSQEANEIIQERLRSDKLTLREVLVENEKHPGVLDISQITEEERFNAYLAEETNRAKRPNENEIFFIDVDILNALEKGRLSKGTLKKTMEKISKETRKTREVLKAHMPSESELLLGFLKEVLTPIDIFDMAKLGYYSAEELIEVYRLQDNSGLPDEQKIGKEELRAFIKEKIENEKDEKQKDRLESFMINNLSSEREIKDDVATMGDDNAWKKYEEGIFDLPVLHQAYGNEFEEKVIENCDKIRLLDLIAGVRDGSISKNCASLCIEENGEYSNIFALLDKQEAEEDIVEELLKDQDKEKVRKSFQSMNAAGIFNNDTTGYIGYANDWMGIDELIDSFGKDKREENIDRFVKFAKSRNFSFEQVSDLYNHAILSEDDVNEMLPESEAVEVISRYNILEEMTKMGLLADDEGEYILPGVENVLNNTTDNLSGRYSVEGQTAVKEQGEERKQIDQDARSMFIDTLGFKRLKVKKETLKQNPEMFMKGYTPHINIKTGMILEENYREYGNATYMYTFHEFMRMQFRSKTSIIAEIESNPDYSVRRIRHTKKWADNVKVAINELLQKQGRSINFVYSQDERNEIDNMAKEIEKGQETGKLEK